jgi:phosphosulfolactate synthase (CoM biosynthesis protein A)
VVEVEEVQAGAAEVVSAADVEAVMAEDMEEGAGMVLLEATEAAASGVAEVEDSNLTKAPLLS